MKGVPLGSKACLHVLKKVIVDEFIQKQVSLRSFYIGSVILFLLKDLIFIHSYNE